jgi:hypothetical protein
VCVVVVGGCSDSGTPGVDATQIPAMITLSGTASAIGLGGRTPADGVAVGVYKVADDTMIGSATTDAAGAYSITVATSGAPVDGYLKASKATFKDTYLYPPGPVTTDFDGASVLLVTPGNWDLVNSVLLGETQNPGSGWLALVVVDNITSQTPIEGATIMSTPTGFPHYNNPNNSGLPQRQATATAADGIGYIVDVPAGQVSVTATKAGSTFISHSVNARADQLTLTIVTQ